MATVYSGTFTAKRWSRRTDVFEKIKIFAEGREIVDIIEKRRVFKVEYTVYIKEKNSCGKNQRSTCSERSCH